MSFKSSAYKLKSGDSIRIKIPEMVEAQKLLELKRGYIENTKSIPLFLDEYPIDINRESEIINDYKNSSNSILLVAEHKDELIGNIDLTGSKRKKMCHTSVIGMGIKEEWRNHGIGRLLIESAIRWAKNNSELELIWLEVYATNVLGFNLYKNMGFKIGGTMEGFFKADNEYVDKISMYQRIK